MRLLDVLANWGPYAPTLVFFWFMAAYAVAGFRGRRYLTKRQCLTYFVSTLILGVFAVVIIVWSPWRANAQVGLWWVFNNVLYFILWPLSLARGLVNERNRWRTFGYARTADVLLFRRPAETSMSKEVTDAERRSNRSMYWWVLATSILLVGVGFLCMSLSPCEWLDIATGRSGCLWTVPVDGVASVEDIAFSPDGHVMATSIWYGQLQFYNTADGNALWELPRQQTRCGQSVTFSSDNKWVATISADDNSVAVRYAETGELVHTFDAITDTVSVQFSPDGKYLAANSRRAGLYFWRTTDWAVQWILPVPTDSFSFSANGRWLAVGTTDKRVGIWTMADITVHQTLNADVDRVVFSPDGTQLATASLFGPINIWDVATGRLIRILSTDNRGELAYSPDGQYLAAGETVRSALSSIYQLSFWRVVDGQRTTTLPAYFSVSCESFAAKSNMFAYGDSKSLKVFRLQND